MKKKWKKRSDTQSLADGCQAAGHSLSSAELRDSFEVELFAQWAANKTRQFTKCNVDSLPRFRFVDIKQYK